MGIFVSLGDTSMCRLNPVLEISRDVVLFLKSCSRCWYDTMWLLAVDMFLCLVCDRVIRLWVTGGGMMISSVSDGSGESGKMK